MQMQEEARVLTCHAIDCSYNCATECCAPQIEVGDSHPMCDTYTRNPQVDIQTGEPPVGACKVTQCHYNQEMDCSASGITLTVHSGHADCATFRA